MSEPTTYHQTAFDVPKSQPSTNKPKGYGYAPKFPPSTNQKNPFGVSIYKPSTSQQSPFIFPRKFVFRPPTNQQKPLGVPQVYYLLIGNPMYLIIQ